MKAMIFAAGLGTRLRPLTNDKPKALVELGGMPLLEIAIRRLKHFGCKEIIVNVHHFADLIIDFLKKKKHFDIRIEISDERKLLLDTGGGLKKAAWFFDDGKPFLVCNADILTNLDLKRFYEYHLRQEALATLAIRNRDTSRYLLFDENTFELKGWKNIKTGEVKWCSEKREGIVNRAFSGMHVIDPKMFSMMQEEAVFSIIDVYLSSAKEHRIVGFPHDDTIWLDVGKPEALEKGKGMIGKIIVL